MVTFIWQRRGRFTLAVAASIMALLAFFVIRLAGPAMATSGGDPYSVPLIVDTNPDPTIVETTLVAQEATVDIGNGVMAHAETINGAIPAPLFQLNVGDTVIVHFENQLSRPTGIHWHGIELDNDSDGTPLTQNQVPPGAKFLYKFKVSRPGIFWYHPHHHSSTNQVFKGLYGPIIVVDPNEAALIASGVIPPATQTLMLALSDITVCKDPGSNDAATYDPSLPWVGGGALPAQQGPHPVDLCETNPLDEDGNSRGPFAAGDVPNIQKNINGATNEGQTVLTNGKNVGGRAGSPSAPGALAAGASTYNVQAGQGLRLHIGNTATIRFFHLRLTDASGTQIPLVRIGGQGGLLDNAVVEGGVVSGFDFQYDSGEILLDAGDRADVVAAIPSTATGVLTLWTEDFRRTGPGFANLPTVPVMHLNVIGTAASVYTIADGTPLRASLGAGALVEAIGPATGTLLDPGAFSPTKPGLPSQEIKLTNTQTATATGLGIDLIKGTHDSPTGDFRDVPHMGSARYARLGDILELQVTNTTSSHHPFHLHGFSIQPLDLTKSGSPTYTWPYHEFRDNVDVTPGYTLRFRVRLDDRPLIDGTTLGGGLGRWMFHCHIFFHSTNGMLSEFDVVDPSGNEKPYVNADAVSVEVNKGDPASMTGTFKDPDSDPVTLSASVGTVTTGAGGTWSWTFPTTACAAVSQMVYITATDSGGHLDQAAFFLQVDRLVNHMPNINANGASIEMNEGQTASMTGTFNDSDCDPVTLSASVGTVTDTGGGTWSWNFHTIDGPDDSQLVSITATDSGGLTNQATFSLQVDNVPPSLAVTSPPTGSLYAAPATVPVTASITDPGIADVLTCTFNWDGGGATSSVTASGGICTMSNTFMMAGVYSITVTGSDDDGGVSAPSTVMIVVYDPSAGFVTGGGTINSPPGAYTANPALTGKANFGFVSKYQKGANVPTGQTEFHFQAASFDFHSTSYDWLVVAGAKAQYKGSGTVAGGTGNYAFMLTATDGQVSGGGGVDKFRLKVWDRSAGGAIVYDNSLGSSDDIDSANPQTIASGSIVIHK